MNSGEDGAFPIISLSSSASHEYGGSVSMSPDSSWKIIAEVSELSKMSRSLRSPSSGTHSGSNAIMYVFEDNKAVRGLYIATEQYSSLCVIAVALTLGGDDIVEVVQDREQVDSER